MTMVIGVELGINRCTQEENEIFFPIVKLFFLLGSGDKVIVMAFKLDIPIESLSPKPSNLFKSYLSEQI